MRFPKFQNPISLGQGLVDAYQNRPKPSETSSLGRGLSILDELIERYGQFMPYGAQVRAPTYFRAATIRSGKGPRAWRVPERQFAPEKGTAEWPIQGVHFAEDPKTASRFGGSEVIWGNRQIFARKLDTRKTFEWYDPVPPRVARNVASQIRSMMNSKRVTSDQRSLLSALAKNSESLANQPFMASVLRNNLVKALGSVRNQVDDNYQFRKNLPVARELGTRFRSAFTKAGYDAVKYDEPIGSGFPAENPAIAILRRPNKQILPIGGKRLQSALVRDRAERARRRMQDER